MIVTPEELKQMEELKSSPHLVDFIRDNPHVLLPCGFDETRFVPSHNHPVEHQTYTPCYREASSGAWYFRSHWVVGEAGDKQIGPFRYRFKTFDWSKELALTTSDILRECRRALTVPDAFAAIVLPNLWLPPDRHARIELVDSISALLVAIKAEKVSLADISWRQLEQVVAELLRNRGMEVTATSASADGGRDIIARGELIPGEPMTLAVEVKHRRVVGLDEVRARLWANREFPALLFATCGRFSAGVVREKRKPENFLRLSLKDGIGLGQWIKEYDPSYGKSSDFL